MTWGSSGRAWAELDELLAPLRHGGAALWPVYGNHDRAPLRRRAERHMEARFPWLRPSPFGAWRVGPLGLVLLDSNRRRLGAAAWESQRAWLVAQLAQWEDDSSVHGVIGVWHHPPYTNSRLVRASRAAREALLGPLLETPKGLAALCGHAHAYERFRVAAREVFVAGGGGGPRQPLRDAGSRAFAPTQFGGQPGGPSRSFLHFLALEVRGASDHERSSSPVGEGPSGPGGVLVRVHRLLDAEEGRGCDVAEEVWMPFGRRPPSASAPKTPDAR